MNIQLDTHKLQDFAAYTGDFPHLVDTECIKLELAAKKLAQATDTEPLPDMQRMLREIRQLLSCSEPDLQKLRDKLNAYAHTVERLQSVLKR